jgi:hypothetical protein
MFDSLVTKLMCEVIAVWGSVGGPARDGEAVVRVDEAVEGVGDAVVRVRSCLSVPQPVANRAGQGVPGRKRAYVIAVSRFRYGASVAV